MSVLCIWLILIPCSNVLIIHRIGLTESSGNVSKLKDSLPVHTLLQCAGGIVLTDDLLISQ